MPITKEIQTFPIQEAALVPETEYASNWPVLDTTMQDSRQPPSPSETKLDETFTSDDSDEWENLSTISNSSSSQFSPHRKNEVFLNSKHFHRCLSTPEFSNLQDEDSYVLDCNSSIDARSITVNSTCDDAVLISHQTKNKKTTWETATTTAKTTTSMKKTPSFKDIIMLNAQVREEEEKRKRQAFLDQEAKKRENARQHRKNFRPRLVVNKIKRCTKSTGDLRSMVIHEDAEHDGYGGGGGGGAYVIHEEEVLGETDAMEFYNRKSKGSQNRRNGMKLRPDEKKRKDIIVHKKNAQRKAQNERSN